MIMLKMINTLNRKSLPARGVWIEIMKANVLKTNVEYVAPRKGSVD